MRRILFLIIAFSLSFAVQAQKKNKSKDKDKTNFAAIDTLASADSLPPPVVKTNSKKGKTTSNYVKKTDKKDDKKDKKGKDDKKGKKEVAVNFKETEAEPPPVADSSKKFTGLIKYRITSDDPADKDSVFIVFGENQIRVTMFIAGYIEGQVFEKNMIANLKDSTFLELDNRRMTYTTEKLTARNEGTEFVLSNSKKTGQVMNLACQEYKGEMTTSEGDVYETACLLSNQHYYLSAADYTLMNVHPLVMRYKIVLGFRTRSEENENTYIIAYKIEPGNTAAWFDLSQYQPK